MSVDRSLACTPVEPEQTFKAYKRSCLCLKCQSPCVLKRIPVVTLQQHATCLATRAFARSPGGQTLLTKEHACQCEAINLSKNCIRDFLCTCTQPEITPILHSLATPVRRRSCYMHALPQPVFLYTCTHARHACQTSCQEQAARHCTQRQPLMTCRFRAFYIACKLHCHRDICQHNANLFAIATTPRG